MICIYVMILIDEDISCGIIFLCPVACMDEM